MTAPRAETGLPPVLPGFEHVNRYWDPRNLVYAAKILPGEYYVSRTGELITTVLGSCVAACIRDRRTGFGGMNHFLLPIDECGGALDDATRYGAVAMESLVNALVKLGARREHLEVKLFGGASVLGLDLEVGVGASNARFAREWVEREGLALLAEDLGGSCARKVIYFPRTGRARVKELRRLRNDTLARRERRYLESAVEGSRRGGGIDLF